MPGKKYEIDAFCKWGGSTKSEYRSTKSETNPKPECLKAQNGTARLGSIAWHTLFGKFVFWSFEFVLDFVLRIFTKEEATEPMRFSPE